MALKKSQNHFDVIVIGVGSMGSAACWYLSKRGYKVLGLEQFEIPHEHGSHFGQSRIIRQAYFEHPDYVPLLERAYTNWREFEMQSNTKLYHETGIVYFGQPQHATMEGVRESASLYSVLVHKLNGEESSLQFPYFTIPSDFETLVEPHAGFLTPELTVSLYAKEAAKLGAVIKTKQRVREWKEVGNKIHVNTDTGEYTAEKLIITAGGWTSKIIPQLKVSLKVTQQTLAWVTPKHPERFTFENFPCWFIEDPELGMYYGFPYVDGERFLGPTGIKLASHRPGTTVDPDGVDRGNFGSDVEIQFFLDKYLPSLEGKITNRKTCLYTYSPDENFIIDHLPGSGKRVTIACGFSGHGFKFVSVIGEILADLAMNGKTDLPAEFLSLTRFK